MSSVVVRLLASLLIAESLFGALRVAGLLSRLSGYDNVAVALILARGLLGALQFISGWLLANRRPQGFALAPWAFVASADPHAVRCRPRPRADRRLCLAALAGDGGLRRLRARRRRVSVAPITQAHVGRPFRATGRA